MDPVETRQIAQAMLEEIAAKGRPVLLHPLDDLVALRRKHARYFLPVMIGLSLPVLGVGWLASSLPGFMIGAVVLAVGMVAFGALRAITMPRTEAAYLEKMRANYAKLGFDAAGGAAFALEIEAAGLSVPGLRAFDPFKDTGSSHGGGDSDGGD